MPRIRPLAGVHAAPELAAEVLAPPYDVLDRAEARAILAERPRSFLAVTRPDATLPDDVDEHDPRVYRAAGEAFRRMLAEGSLVQDPHPALYVYTQRWRDHEQSGLLALCAVDDYLDGTIRRHEHTRPDKERDRVEHILGAGAQTGLVFLAHRPDASVAALHDAAAALPPLFRVRTPDGVEHALRRVDDELVLAAWIHALEALPRLYIADGHHRSAAAARVAERVGGDGPHRWFLAGIFPADRLCVLPYNRLVADLGGRDAAAFAEALGRAVALEPAAEGRPAGPGEARMYLDGRWWSLRPPAEVLASGDPVERLDVAWLQDLVLGPLLGIADPRTDARIRFVGGIRGIEALVEAVDAGRAAVAFSMAPTPMDALFEVADAGRVMPPKSTWFEPKLAGGVLAHRLA